MSQVCALQKAFGKTKEELEVLVEGFNWALSDYDMEEIMLGIKEHIRTQSDVPAPADIIKIMDLKREYKKYLNPPIEKLLSYKKKGLPLSDIQKERIKKYEAGER